MKKKCYILALTFLCLLIGQSSFGQETGGDYEEEVCTHESTDFAESFDCVDVYLTQGEYYYCESAILISTYHYELYIFKECGTGDSGDCRDPSSSAYPCDSGDPCDPSSLSYNPDNCPSGDSGTGGGSGGGGGGSTSGSNVISPVSLLKVAQGNASSTEFYNVDSKIRAAVNATGLAAGFTGSSMDAITAITKEIGFSVKTFGSVGTSIGAAGTIIGGIEVVIAAKEAYSGENPWTEADTLNAISTALGTAALVPGPHSLICGGLSIMVGLVGTAYSN